MEGSCSGSSRGKSRAKDDFIDMLLSWSLDKICDENLYKNQVEKIPESFESADQYLDSYIFPLLEEIRAELASALKAVNEAPFAEVTSFKKSKHGKSLFDVKVDDWKNRTSDRGKEPYRTLPGDFVLLSELKPASIFDLQHAGLIYTFAFVKTISDDDRGGFTLKTAGSFEVGDQQNESLYVVYLTNEVTHQRIWNALRMRRNMKIIDKVLTKNVLDDENCELCPLKCLSEVEEELGTKLLSKINESQHEAIMASISKSGCSHKSSVELIWGPPGTGKTTTLSILLYILLRLNVRTLICAPTNIAITELASRVTALVRNSVEVENEKSFSPCPLGEMLIFGNKDRLKIGSDVQGIFLDYRVESLMHCLVPSTGWRHCIASMIDFLEDCVSQHQIFVENELMKSEELVDGETQQSGSKSFLEFASKRFTHAASHLRSCVLTIITHLPRSFIHEENYEGIVQLISLLDTLKIFLVEDSCMKSDDLEAIFVQQVMVDFESVADTSSLHYIRSQCLSILRDLQASLSQLVFPIVGGETSTMNFCFQKASLIFCTISSSYKLHSVDMNPFHVLVIDEAAQVKECETTIALQIADVRRAILVGDEMQLPATVSSKLSKEAGLGRSLFERLSLIGHSKHLLNVQYRMHPSISRFPNSNFYSNQIKDAPNVQSESHEKCYLQGGMFAPYSFINVDGKEESDDVGPSLRNMVEVGVIVKLVQKLFTAWNGSKEELSIGLISPYAAQVAAIRNMLQSKYDNLERFTVKVNSIDGFQGGEEDIIIISTVRSNKRGDIGFLSDRQRTNVALTRARHCLWIYGSERTLNGSGSVWEALVSDAKEHQCFFNAADDSDLRKITISHKTQFEQDDLLSGESILFNSSRWQVIFSDNFRKSFCKLKSKKKLVIQFLLKLASGWRPKKQNVDWNCESSSYIVKQFNVDIYCVVCSIDIIKDSIYKQVLKVWDILPKTDTAKLLKRLDSISSMYTDDFVNYCNDKLFEGSLEVPKSWSLSSYISRFKNPNTTKLTSDASASSAECTSYVENTKVSESLLLMKFYSLSAGAVNHLLSDVEGKEMDLPFEVTDEEREIITFPRSSFIIGRSGTGKTTILTMKLYQKFQQYCIASRDSVASNCSVHSDNEVDVDQYHGLSRNPVLHQLFVTVSPKLCHAVKKHISQLKSFAIENYNFTGMDDLDEMAEFKAIPDTFFGLQQEKYPLIITFHKFLMMLDGTLGNSYFQRFPDVKGSSHYEGRRSFSLQAFMRKNEVTFDRFWSFYWPHFNMKLTKSLDASRVFTEIMSHIKGGMHEGEACDSKRSREDYVSLSECRTSTLSAEERNVIYDIFQDYEKMKLERGEFDLADFVIDIHFRLKNEDLLGDKMDFVYIDEVQDLTMRQISLFRYICKNVDEGFVFSGDTAQTIARGIDFRFEDIRSLFYNEFVMKSRDCDLPGRKKGLISDMFSLSQNFRTHNGVLRLAKSVIDLICYYFPLSIDSLAPETSLICGESPVVLEPGSDEDIIISIFGHSGKSGGKWVGFGADQVILVRDDSARKEVSRYIGDQALVLTILECKGLEFQDVLLYNFFGSSPMSNQWRVVYEFLKEKDLLDGNSPKSFPSFIKSRHNILCSELKQLYVAITRTRQRLWICENNVEISKPMLDYWRRLGLVQERKLDDSLAEVMQRASSPEEWKSQGIKLFWENNYEMAIMCFEKAGDESWEKRAKASGFRAAAESLRGSNPEEASTMLRQAAEIFDSIDRSESAAECFFDLGEYDRAGRIYLEKCGSLCLRKAAECFSLAGSYETAAEVYAKGNFLTECLSACTKGNHFDLGLQYIECWKQQASLDSEIMARFKEIDRIAQEFLQNCASKCYKENDKTSLMKFVRAFPSMESKRNFLKSLDCLEELLVLEEESGNFDEAAEIAKSLGDILHEIDLLEKAEHFKDFSMLILSYVLAKSLWVSGNQGWPLKSFPEKTELINRAMLAAQKVSGTYHESICVESKILLCEHRNLYELMQLYHASIQYKTPIGEVLSIQKLLDAHIQVNATKYEWDHELHLDPGSFDERMLKNQVSGGTLFYVWNLWKVKILDILECLDSLEKLESIKVEGTARFCFNYFGVRLMDDFGACHLMNSDAAWVRNVDKRFMRLNRKVTTLEARHFAPAARKSWHQELVSVGLRVLEALQKIYQSSKVKCLHKYFQSMCMFYIFDVANFFLKSSSFDKKKAETRRLQDSVALSTEYFKTAIDKKSLMKFVWAFPSMESKRTFLKSLDCLEELLVLEEELGNFDEAAEIAKSLGDILHEIDLLEKAEHFKDFSMLILSYVLAKSLWVSGNRGWPLKSFPEKTELINRAMLAAQKVSGTYHESICVESKILLCEHRNLYELMQLYHASIQYKTPIGEVLSIQKLLDAHIQVNATKYEWDHELHLDLVSFEERMLKNQVSSGTLFYVWNLWKLKILDIVECLDSLEKPESIKVEGTARFCFNYFGVRLMDDFGVACHLMNTDAAWVRNVDKRSMRLNRKVTTLEARHFAPAARKSWHQELVSVGLRVLEALQKIYQSSKVKCLHKYFQSMCLLYIFDVANFFLESSSFDMKKDETRRLQDSVALSTEYFKIVFPLDPQQSLSEDMISLRETELSKNVLEEVVDRNINTANNLTYGQIGQTAMILLGSGKLRRALYERIGERISKSSSWKSLFENLKNLPITTSADGVSHSVFLQESSLSRELHGALVETYNVNWRLCDYISPDCFFYLVERLLILTPRSHGFFFTTKSSFVEHLVCLSTEANPRSSLITDNNSCSTDMALFYVRVIEQCLSNSRETAEWIGKSKMNCNIYFPVLVLRLLMILCLLCLSWDLTFEIVYTKLSLHPIRSKLPRKFVEALWSKRGRDNSNESAVAGAFKEIGDPLVIIVSSENNFTSTLPDAIFLDLRAFSCKYEIIKTLFPQSTAQPIPAPAEQSVAKRNSNVAVPILQSSDMSSKTAPSLSLEKGKDNLQFNLGLIRELSDAFESLRNIDFDGNLKSPFLRMKAQVEKLISLLTTAVAQLTDQKTYSAEDKDLSRNATRIVEEVIALSSLLSTSDFDAEALSSEILKSLEAWQPQLDALLSQLKVQNDPKPTVVVSEDKDDHEKISDNNGDGDGDDIKTEDLAAATSNPSNQGKGKKKKKNKQKKGKRSSQLLPTSSIF